MAADRLLLINSYISGHMMVAVHIIHGDNTIIWLHLQSIPLSLRDHPSFGNCANGFLRSTNS